MSLLGTPEAQTVINNLQQQTHVRKTFYNPYKKRFESKTIRPRTIVPPKLPFFPSVESKWVGDTMNKNPSRGYLRFWVQNCNGLKPKNDANFQHTCTQLHEYGMHYFAFTETNVNISNPHNKVLNWKIRYYQHTKFSYTCNISARGGNEWIHIDNEHTIH